MHRFLLFLLPVLLMLQSCQQSSTSEYGTFSCDAETTSESGSKTYFESEHLLFSQGQLQDDTHARSGSYSCKLTPEEPFGMGIKIEAPKPGAWVTASVWRYDDSKKAQLVIRDSEGKQLNYGTQTGHTSDSLPGWEKLTLQVQLAKDINISKLVIFVDCDKAQEAWFDDFEISYQPAESITVPEELEQIRLQIPDSSFALLSTFRERALINGMISKAEKVYVPAVLITAEDSTKVKIRLKGDWTDHLLTDKWSYRLKLPGGTSWKGMRSFTIQSPHTRGGLNEWKIHQLCHQEDVLTTRYGFISVTINDNYPGVYAYEEHFDKQLVESAHRREGPILKFDESGRWSVNKNGQRIRCAFKRSFVAADILVFKQGRTMRNPVLKNQFLIAQNLVQQYRLGAVPTSQIFDTRRMAKYVAIAHLAGSKHTLDWINQRFYYNPVISKLEPVAYDFYTQSQHHAALPFYFNPDTSFQRMASEQKIQLMLLKDEVFLDWYMHYIELYTSDEFIDQFEASVKEQENDLHSHLADFEWHPYDADFLRHQAELLRPHLPELRTKLTHLANQFEAPQGVCDEPLPFPFDGIAVKAFVSKTEAPDTSYFVLDVCNYHTGQLSVTGYTMEDQPMVILANELVLPGHGSNLAIGPEMVSLTLPISSCPEFLHFQFDDSTYRVPVRPWTMPEATSTSQELMTSKKLTSNRHYAVEGNQVTFNVGRRSVQEPIIIPEGYTVIFPAGTELVLAEGAHIISRSPVFMNGTELSPVSISTSYKASFSVLQAKEKSRLEHVIFRNLNTLDHEGWKLTGAVTFYESDVDILHSAFKHAQCEDGLNIIRSKFSISNCSFENTFSDALDIDFGEGTITSSKFVNAGNDAIDLSGATVEIDDVYILNSGDKGISTGEQATLTANKVGVKNAVVGIASKDLSTVTLTNPTLVSCDTAYAVYCKKGEYGPAQITLIGEDIIQECSTSIFVENESVFITGQDTITGTPSNLRSPQ